MYSSSNNISLPPCAPMDPSFDGDLPIRSPTASVHPPIASRTQTAFSPPVASSNTYTGLNPAYFTYHPAPYPYTDHLQYIVPPLERAYQFDRPISYPPFVRTLEQPSSSHSRSPVPPLVRPAPRALPRIYTRPDRTAPNPEASRTTSPVHRVVTRPLLPKNRPKPENERVFAPGPAVYSSRSSWTHPSGLQHFRCPSTSRMEDGTDRMPAGRKRKSSYDEGESDTKPHLDELPGNVAKYRQEETQRADEAIIPGVALNINGTSGFPHYNSAHASRPNLASRPSGSNISPSSSPGNKTSGNSGMASSNRTPSLTPRSFPVGVSNGTINPNARGLGGDGQDMSADGGFGESHVDNSENAQDKAKRKKPRVALSCAQCTKVSRSRRDRATFAVLTIVQRKQKCNREIPCQHCTGKFMRKFHGLI